MYTMSKNERKSIKSRLSDENQMNKIIQFDKKTYPGSRQHFVQEIDRTEIINEEVVGKGSFGVVWKGIWCGRDVAVKYIADSDADREAFTTETRELSRNSNRNIIRLYGMCIKKPICLVLKFADGGTLYDVAEHQRQSSQRLYDPLQYSANSNNAAVKRLDDENEPNKMNEDEMSWKNKCLHEIKLCTELQDRIDNQDAVISHLKQRIEKLRDYKEQVIVLKVEREHLENKVKMLNEKVKYLVTPGTE
ncbi:hypothetical protein PV328_011993 [Microctonus aethiopoides]|uniref:Protein kinase domain-containing protein n=1 Tax=Microctonus aethiopoides TaxID=144406 RepID=A0AA39C333_9HYME|nr:hypothetical protein PV328_011993 [Microctonus aethiopoides]